ncbi:MAG: ABC transporter substrate-binding protein [Bacteroidales bacterium]|jgi:branched-chain amino acid transport system substrate-binding protein
MRLQKLFFHTFFFLVFLGFIAGDVKAFQNTDRSGKTVKIGLLIPDNNSQAAKYGAELAIRNANEKGGFNGKPFQLVVRSMEGPWGTGSKQAVNLIFEENVCALMGSPDGRNAHLVEQVTTKARIVFLSAWASDPTLAQAFVPWYFSCVPTDLQQADALIEEIYNKRQFTKIAAVSDNDYDSKMAMESFVKRAKLSGKTTPLQLFYDNKAQDYNDLINQINKAGVRGIILFGKPSASMRIINQLRERKMDQSLFGSLSLLDENEIPGQVMKYYENVALISPGNLSGSKGLAFREEFQKTYGKLPGAVAAYSFDGMNLLIEAIRNAGIDRENIQKALAKIKFEGVTGPIQFDGKGKRMGTPGLMEIKNGVPVTVER